MIQQQQQTYFLELYRAGVRAASEIAKASLENAQRLHTQQAESLREALDANVRSTRQLSEANSVADLMALQVRLAGTQAEQAAGFWTQAWRTASESQAALLGQMRESYSVATRAAEGAMNNGVEAVREVERKAQQPHRRTA